MIKLFQFPSCWGLPNASPFCMKLEAYMRLTKIPYEIKSINDPSKGPKHKIPYVEMDGKRIGDSTLIVDLLKEQHGDPLDKNLNRTEQAQSLAFQRLLEEHLYWIIVYSRWMDEKIWPIVKKTFFSGMPKIMGNIISSIIRRKMRKTLYDQGIGRHTQTEIYDFGKKDIDSVANFLGDKQYFFGDNIHTIDTCVYSFMAGILCVPFDNILKSHAQTHANLNTYCERMKEKVYG